MSNKAVEGMKFVYHEQDSSHQITESRDVTAVEVPLVSLHGLSFAATSLLLA